MFARSGGSAANPGSGLVPLVIERLPSLDGVAPAHAAERFRDLPGLGLLEGARPGRAGHWSILVADPRNVLAGSSAGQDPFADARRAR